jgi:hypothetical protein
MTHKHVDQVNYKDFCLNIKPMGNALAIKMGLMLTFFLEVTIFGNCVSSLACFHNKRVMDLAMTFSGTLFLSIAMIDVIP